MVELFESDEKTQARQSSKGNQLKWENNGVWYKADYTGYEGLQEFGKYMNKLLTIDAFFLNEDRHMHNIAVLMNGDGEFDYCPIFDNGAGLLADI